MRPYWFSSRTILLLIKMRTRFQLSSPFHLAKSHQYKAFTLPIERIIGDKPLQIIARQHFTGLVHATP